MVARRSELIRSRQRMQAQQPGPDHHRDHRRIPRPHHRRAPRRLDPNRQAHLDPLCSLIHRRRLPHRVRLHKLIPGQGDQDLSCRMDRLWQLTLLVILCFRNLDHQVKYLLCLDLPLDLKAALSNPRPTPMVWFGGVTVLLF